MREIIVKSAIALTEEQKAKLEAGLRAADPQSELRFRYQIDRIVGGIVVIDGEDVYDASIAAELRKLKKSSDRLVHHGKDGKGIAVQDIPALLKSKLDEMIDHKHDYEVCGKVIRAAQKPKNLKELRKNVGLVFQFPEYQLFEETIEKDIAFGPKNFGVDEEEAGKTVRKVLPLVGLGEEYLSRSPFELSGGQKRRVAIAGILAMDPGVLVLDEPTAGLDPQGAKEMMELFVRMNQEFHKTVLLVTHDMEHVLKYCDHVIVVRNGTICCDQEVRAFFRDTAILDELRITPPAVIRLREALNARGFHLSSDLLSLSDLAEAAASEVKHHE